MISKETWMHLWKNFFLPTIVLSAISSIFATYLFEVKDIFPTKYIAQSQMVININSDKDSDDVKKMDLLKYNENFNALMYSPDFLDNVNSKLEKTYKDVADLKSKISLIYSQNSQVITVQSVSGSKRESLDLVDVISKNLCTEGAKFFTYGTLAIMSSPKITNEFQQSITSVMLGFFTIFLTTYSIIFLFYINRRSKRSKKSKKNSRRSRRN